MTSGGDGRRGERLVGKDGLWLPGRLDRRAALGMAAGGFAAGLLGTSRPVQAATNAVFPPASGWVTKTPAQLGFDATKLAAAVKFGSAAGGSGFVARHGYQVASWGSPSAKYNLESGVKAIGSMLLGIALQKGLVQLPKTVLTYLTQAEFAIPKQNALTGPGWLAKITLQHLLDHTPGYAHPGGFKTLIFAPGTYYHYTNCGANWLADVMTVQFGADLLQVFKQQIASPIGMGTGDYFWRTNAYRPPTLRNIPRREIAAGLDFTAAGLGRIAHLLLHQGKWGSQQLVPSAYLQQAAHVNPALTKLIDYETKQLSDLNHYNMYFEDNDDGSYPSLPHDVMFVWGNFDNHFFALPAADMVVVRLGTKSLGDTFQTVDSLAGNFLRAIVS